MTHYRRPVVIVDDDVDHAVIARTVLASVAPDAPVTTLTDPRDLAARLAEAPRDAVVLIDRMLDLVESFPLIQRVSSERPDLRFVMLSAALSSEDAGRAIEAGAAGAAEKPGSISAWQTLLTRLLAEADGQAREERGGAVA